jgi:translation elongation factor EF-4
LTLPRHVDFSYEVSRSIAACEGALLLIDATQGVQAQTISNLYLAIENNLEIIPILNKMDMPAAMPDEVKDQIIDLIGCDSDDIIEASGKTGQGVEKNIELQSLTKFRLLKEILTGHSRLLFSIPFLIHTEALLPISGFSTGPFGKMTL